MKKNIWIINHYAGGMLFSKGGRHYAFAKYMKRAGYEPVIFCCNARHNSEREQYIELDGVWQEMMAEEIAVPFVFVQGRVYKGNGKQRVLNMIDFYRNVKNAAKAYAIKHGNPDVIYASSVHPLTLVAGIQLAKYFKVKCICEVRDLWPESLVAYGIVGARNPAVFALRLLEKWIYIHANTIVFTMEGAYDYIKEQGWERAIPREKVQFINNGVDLELFDYNRERYPTEDLDFDNPNLFKVVYTGSVRKVNNLGLLLDAAKLVKDDTIRFLIWGDGDELDMLTQRIRNENIRNVVFKGRVAKSYIPYITSRADLNIAHNAPSPLFKYGISFNKAFDYFAAGKPILCDFSSQYNPVIQRNGGIAVKDSTCEKVAEAITSLAHSEQTVLERYGKNARNAAEQFYNYTALTERLLHVLERTD